MTWLLLTAASDRLIMMIGPSGLLLVVPPHLFAVPVSVRWVGLQKKYTELNLGCETIIFLQGHILSTTSGDALTLSKHCHVNYSTLLTLTQEATGIRTGQMNWDLFHTLRNISFALL